MRQKYKKGDRRIYENVFDGLSFYQTTGEVYHTNRSKSKFHKHFLRSLSGVTHPTVLDVGCFIGTELFMLPPLSGLKRYGVDVSQDAISYAQALAKKRGETNIKFRVVDANKQLPFPNNYFDLVYALELIEHLKNPLDFFKQAYKVLKPGGTLIVSTPNSSNLQNWLFQVLPGSLRRSFTLSRLHDFTRHGRSFAVDAKIWDHEAHISLLSPSQWRQIINQAGFQIESLEGSSAYGGARYISDRPLLLGLAILADALIDLLPGQPYLQMCLIASLKKSYA